ncbi:MAG: methylenetetrahydrofolate--tRNA-(uracil-5-)-methyltransferase, partial [Clostridia bacterium]|nr:methylenetetrahydrofolate--tRNA-(uracil-5-)-methyltransferase [Clostridia bacterium]
VVQMRRDNLAGTLYNLVGYQTSLKWGEQERVFRLIPVMEAAEYARFCVMHRNTYINSPRVLQPTLQLKEYPSIFLAGQLTGVEGYIESAACGLVAGVNAARYIKGQEPLTLPVATAHGALLQYITDPTHDPLQPMHINFGLLPPLARRVRGRETRNRVLAERALQIWSSLGEFSGN